jgi:hypothetical protein
MSCQYHPDKSHVCFCTQCGVPLCESCVIVFEGRQICQSCRNSFAESFESGRTPNFSNDYSSIYGDGREPCAWELRKQIGFLKAAKQTIADVMFRPVSFFSTLRPNAPVSDALMFLLLVVTPFTMVATLVNGLLMTSIMSLINPNVPLGSTLAQTLLQTILAPATAIIGIYIIGGLTHLGLMLMGARKYTFDATIRTMCYGSAPNFLSIIPIAGAFIGPVWSLICEIIGIARVHDTSYGKAAFAVLWFMLVAFCCFGLLILVGITALTAIK